MSEAKPQNDPSMDDILASIRKIISDDEARAGNAPGPGRPPSMPRPAPAARPFDAGDDVLLLTELIEEPPARAAPRPAADPRTIQTASRPAAPDTRSQRAADEAAISTVITAVPPLSPPRVAALDPGDAPQPIFAPRPTPLFMPAAPPPAPVFAAPPPPAVAAVVPTRHHPHHLHRPWRP